MSSRSDCPSFEPLIEAFTLSAGIDVSQMAHIGDDGKPALLGNVAVQ